MSVMPEREKKYDASPLTDTFKLSFQLATGEQAENTRARHRCEEQ